MLFAKKAGLPTPCQIILVARMFGRKGNMWDKVESEGEEPHIDYSNYMTQARHREIKYYLGYLFADKSLENDAPWWRISKLVPEFNNNRKKTV